jgi:hypothetical protein
MAEAKGGAPLKGFAKNCPSLRYSSLEEITIPALKCLVRNNFGQKLVAGGE